MTRPAGKRRKGMRKWIWLLAVVMLVTAVGAGRPAARAEEIEEHILLDDEEPSEGDADGEESAAE